MKPLRNIDIRIPTPAGEAFAAGSARPDPHDPATLPDATADEAPALEALRLVLDSEEFRASQQLSAFLTFSVGRTLEGRGATLKAYTIATEVFRRGPDFDPQIDPIVRVEATRLRRALERFYGGGGADHPVRIVLPRGSYAVSFERNDRKHAAADADASRTADALRAFGRRLPRFGGEDSSVSLRSAAAAVVLGMSIWIAMPVKEPEPKTAFLVGERAGAVERMLPTAMAVIASDETLASLAEDLRDALAAMPRFEVSSRPDAFRAEAADGVLVKLRTTGEADAARIVVRLLSAKDGVILWTASFPRTASTSGQGAAADAIAEAIARNEALKRFGSRTAGSTNVSVDRPS